MPVYLFFIVSHKSGSVKSARIYFFNHASLFKKRKMLLDKVGILENGTEISEMVIN